MPLTVPQSVNFSDPLTAVPIGTYEEPRDGRRMIPVELAWQVALAKNLTSFNINLQNNATLEFSKVSGLVVDNSNCGSDIDIIFPDIAVTITIPAYSPYDVLPVFSNQQQFWVKARGAINGDLTYIGVLNFAPEPVAVPITQQQKAAALSNANIVNGTTTIVAAPTNGTLQGLNVNFAVQTPAAAFNAQLVVKDGNNSIIWEGNVAAAAASTGTNGELISINGLNVRFQGGLFLTISGAPAGALGTVTVNSYYITP